MLLYIEGVFNLVRGQTLFLAGIAMFPSAWAIANNKRWGWRLGVVAASAAILIRLAWYGLSSPMTVAFALLFPVVLLTLLLHPQSREHQRIWFD